MKKNFYLLSLILCFSCKRDIPPTPGAITGPTTFCMGSTQNYSIAAVLGTSYYLWNVPSDATIVNGQGTTAITVIFGKQSGQISVRSNNSKEASSDAAVLQVTQGCNSGQWCRQTDFGGAGQVYAVGFSIGAKGYIGIGATNTFFKSFWEYDPTLNTWTQKADFAGTPRSGAAGFSIGSYGYVGTGFDITGNGTNDFWQFNPSTNTWVQKTHFAGTARYGAVGFAIGNKGYIGTGYDTNYEKDFWEYNPTTDSWTQLAPFGGSQRYLATGFSIGNKGYIGTGDSAGYLKSDFWEYDVSLNAWTERAPFAGNNRCETVSFSIGNYGYIGTGSINPAPLNPSYFQDFWQYSPLPIDRWVPLAPFIGAARSRAVGFSIGTSGFIGTGYNGVTFFNDFYQYQQ